MQFHASHRALDLQLLRCIKQTYAGFVPHHSCAGELHKAHIYTMDTVSSILMYLAREQLHQDNYHLLQQTLKDYARFFASVWHNRSEVMPSPSCMLLFNNYLSQLRTPPHFCQILDYLISRLPGLFVDDWPMVPNHSDLWETNIHVKPGTDRLMGICDWKGAEVRFGMSLGGLETMLGTS